MAKIHRFIDNFELSSKEIEITGEIAHQMAKVLKLEVDEQVELCDGKGKNILGKIKSINKNSVVVEAEKTWVSENEPTRHVSLFCAVLKKENFEWVVEKATECGVSKIIPIITTRTIKMGLNMERLIKIAKEASEQSGRSFIPKIHEPISFDQSLEMTKENKCNIFFDAGGEDLLYKMPWERDGASTSKNSAEFYGCILDNKSSPYIFIGPEGGWTEEENKKAKDTGFKIASLGKLILRGETAAIVATYLSVNLK